MKKLLVKRRMRYGGKNYSLYMNSLFHSIKIIENRVRREVEILNGQTNKLGFLTPPHHHISIENLIGKINVNDFLALIKQLSDKHRCRLLKSRLQVSLKGSISHLGSISSSF